jgi:hypothetical protein
MSGTPSIERKSPMQGSTGQKQPGTTSGFIGQTQFDVPPSVLASKISDGKTYLLIEQGHQSEEPRIWSTGDGTQAAALFQQVARSFDLQTT